MIKKSTALVVLRNVWAPLRTIAKQSMFDRHEMQRTSELNQPNIVSVNNYRPDQEAPPRN